MSNFQTLYSRRTETHPLPFEKGLGWIKNTLPGKQNHGKNTGKKGEKNSGYKFYRSYFQ